MINSADILKAGILIIDDEEPNVILLERTLHNAGYTSITSTMNPQKVCELYRINRYDLILLDIRMPGMDGFQVMEGLKKIDTDFFPPVLVITAEPGHKERALQAGAKDFVSKPFELVEVLTRVHNMLEAQLLRKEIEEHKEDNPALSNVIQRNIRKIINVELVLEIRDPQNQIIQSVAKKMSAWRGEQEIAAFAIASPKLWSPSSPALYHCSVTLKSLHGEQIVRENFGVRSVEWVEHGPFKLNGERLLLRGTQYHEDHAGVGAAVPDEVVRKTFRQIKDMGANFVRLGHYQQSPLVLELCDELGLLVWEEIPWCRGGLGGEHYQQQCRDMLTDLIDQHYNHPSVILWGLGNEIDWPGDFETYDTNAIRSFMTELNTLAHRLDPSRQTCIRRCDFCKDIVDVYSPSIWAGWYSGRYTEYRAATEKAIADNQHFFHAEWGADSMAGRHAEEPEKFLGQVATGEGTAEVGKAYKADGGKSRASRDGDWSESYAINLFDWTLHEQETMSNLTGSAMWIFKDFPTPLRPENPVPRVNQKGVVARDGMPKESYFVFQSYWSDKPMLHIYGHTWPVRWGKASEEKEVKVFSNCHEVELFVNGVSAGVKQRNSTNFPAAGLHWNVKLNEGTNTLRAVGKSAAGTEVADEIFQAYQTAEWSAPAKLTLTALSRSNDVCVIEARMLDKDGVPCLDTANIVRFGITGDGKLLDNLGTATGSRVVQLANGRAQTSLQLLGRKAVVSVASKGLTTKFMNVMNAN